METSLKQTSSPAIKQKIGINFTKPISTSTLFFEQCHALKAVF
jgi:hypothetical protein